MDGEHNQSTRACPQCEQHLLEISRLQDEIAQLREDSWSKPTARWSTRAAIGTFLFATLPNIPFVIFEASGVADGHFEPLIYTLWGLTIGSFWAQWSLLGVFCMLWDQRVLQRVLVYFGLGSTFVAMTFVCTVAVDAGDQDVSYFGYASPFLSIAILIPAFVARSTRRWTITQRNSTTVARPVSLSSYLLLMTVIGVFLAVVKFFPWREIADNLESATPYLLVFGGPLLSVGCLHVWMLPRFLGHRTTRSASWRQWLLLGMMVLFGVVFSVGGFAGFLIIDDQLDWREVLTLTPLPLSLLISATVVIAAGCCWLRLLDYELSAK